MKWNENEIDQVLFLIKSGKTYQEISLIINRTEGSIRSKAFLLGEKTSTYNIPNEISCKECGILFKGSDKRVFCSQRCNAIFNNMARGYKSIKSSCLNCSKEIQSVNKYCSRECQIKYDRSLIFLKIENGDESLYERNYKKYLIYKYGEKCMECGWCEVNKKTGKIPIQMEHIDGHYENNNLDNLKLLCPNCHSLTPTYGSLNKGNGRPKRYKSKLK